MDALSVNIIKEIELLFSSFQKMFNKHHLFLFPDLKKGDIKPLAANDVSDFDKILHLKDDIPVNAELIDKRHAAQYPFLEELFKHYQLNNLLAIKTESAERYFLALSSGSQAPISESKRLFSAYGKIIRFILDNEILKTKLTESTEYLKQMLNEMSVLHEISRSIDSSHNLDSLLQFIVKESMQLMNAEAGSLMLVIPDTDEMEFKIAFGPKSEGVKPFRLKIGKGIAGWVAEHGQPILIPDAYADPRFDSSFDKRSGFKTQSYLCVPLTYNTKVIGVMTVLNRLDGLPFAESDKELLETFATQAALAIENAKLLKEALEKERLEQELKVAAEIQQRIIPDKIPETKTLDIAATYIPAREISGDFYDIFALDDQSLLFVVADVAGKGVPAALLVATMQASLRAYFEFSNDILSVVTKLNQKIIANTTEDRFITFFMGVLNLKENSFTYVNAGHNPPLLFQGNQQVKELKTGGIFLGMTPWQYEAEKVTLDKDGILVLFTDGLIEAMNSEEEEFGEDRLQTLLVKNKQSSAKKLVDLVVSKVRQHTGDVHLQDDFTLVVVKRK